MPAVRPGCRFVNLERKIKTEAGRFGADLCGFASMDRFENAPAGFHPRDVLKTCRAVISLAIRFPHATLQASTNAPYTMVRNQLVEKTDRLTCNLAAWMEDNGCTAVPIPSADPYDYWDEAQIRGMGIISLKHAAQASGLGRIGKNTLLITPEFGNMVWLGAILIDQLLEPNPLAEYTACPEKCTACLDACQANALDGVTLVQKKCRPHSISNTPGGGFILACNTCRKVCPNRFGFGQNRSRKGVRDEQIYGRLTVATA